MILALSLFCAASFGGCGGSSASVSESAENTTGSDAESAADIAESAAESQAGQTASEAESVTDTVTDSSADQMSTETDSTVFATGEEDVVLSDDSSDFVLLSEAVPDAILEMEPLAFLTKEAAAALKEVSDDLVSQGYRLKIFDAYRPQMAVTHFMNWALDPDDVKMKEYFYPELEKDTLFPQGYIAEHSGHSRGSTVDLTLFDMKTEKEVDMGGTFDYFGELSHPDYKDITDEQYANRMILRDAMLRHGFKPLVEEWWHFTLEDEPYPDTYFTFPVNSDSLKDVA